MLLAAGLMLTVLFAAPDARPADEVRAAARKVLDDSGYQRQLPAVAPEVSDKPASPPVTRRLSRPGPVAHIASWLLWILLAGVLVVGLLWLAQQWRGGEAAQVDLAATTPGTGSPAPPPVRPLGEADVLAETGRYADAIHVLLLAAIREMAQRLSLRIPDSDTSREVLGAAPVGAAGRDALGRLVRAVELTRFGDAAADADDYARCLSHYRRFVAECDAADRTTTPARAA